MDICNIALKYGYADQPAFSNAFRKEFGITPKTARISNVPLPNNRFSLNVSLDNAPVKTQSLLEKTFDDLDTIGYLTGKKADYLCEFTDASNEFNFDIDTCYAIAELAERLGVPLYFAFPSVL